VQTLLDRGAYLLLHPDTKQPIDADDPTTYPANDAAAMAKAKVHPNTTTNKQSPHA
jgi:hypothetical protein